MATTDDRGEYRLTGAVPGRAYVVLAKRRWAAMDPISTVPVDPKLRRPAARPTYYPDSPSIDGAEWMVLRAGETREGVDIRMARGPSHCIEGVVDAGPGALFRISERHPSNGDIGPVLMGGGVTVAIPSGKTGSDGKIRICDLHPGQYQLSAVELSGSAAATFGTTLVAVGSEDVRDIRVIAQPGSILTGQVVWDGAPPEKPVESQIRVTVSPLTRNAFSGERQPARSLIPGGFSFPSLFLDDYAVRVTGVPRELYIKDVTYAGRSVLHEPLRLGSSVGSQELRVIVARDGGFLTVSVSGKENKPVPHSNVFIMPASAVSEAELASVLVAGQADQRGIYTTTALAPGKYYVLASGMLADTSPETLGALWRARLKAKEVQVAAGATMQVTVEP
jgi:hypothetical protein